MILINHFKDNNLVIFISTEKKKLKDRLLIDILNCEIFHVL